MSHLSNDCVLGFWGESLPKLGVEMTWPVVDLQTILLWAIGEMRMMRESGTLTLGRALAIFLRWIRPTTVISEDGSSENKAVFFTPIVDLRIAMEKKTQKDFYQYFHVYTKSLITMGERMCKPCTMSLEDCRAQIFTKETFFQGRSLFPYWLNWSYRWCDVLENHPRKVLTSPCTLHPDEKGYCTCYAKMMTSKVLDNLVTQLSLYSVTHDIASLGDVRAFLLQH